MRHGLLTILAAIAVFGSGTARAEAPVRLFAAASLTNALGDIAARWQTDGHPQAILVFGSSSLLAKQVEAGAPTDVFASADRGWMDYLDAKGLIDRPSRVDLLGNALVLIASRGHGFHVEMEPGFAFASAFPGRLCIGEPGVVPAGSYARQALESLGWWEPLKARVVGTDDVRSALAFVERGECGAGVVYATDATGSGKVEVLARFPADRHEPIVYPFALTKGARAEGRRFMSYLRSPAATAIFQRYGFLVLRTGR